MPTNLTCFRIFIASPGGLGEERRAFRDEIQDYNDSEAIHRGVLFQPFGWEDTLGGVGRPQSIINEDVRSSDFFVLLLWNRWGSAPDVKSSRFTSGTEEEYHVALECYEATDRPMRQLVMLFKAVDPQQLSDPGPQLESVLKFKQEMEEEKTHLFHTFDTIARFQQLLRAHLAAWLRGWENDSDIGGKSPPELDIVGDTGFVGDGDGDERPEAPEPVDTSLTAKAWALADEGRLTEAEVEFARAIVGRQQPEALMSYGQFLYRVGRLDQARVLFERAIEIAEDQSDQQFTLASAYGNLGLMLQIRGDLHGAEKMYRTSLEINETLGHREGMASAYVKLGNVLQIREDLEGAEQMYRKSLEVDEKLGRLEGGAEAYRNLGTVLLLRGNLDGAKQMYRKSLEINEQMGNLEGMAKAYGNLGLVLRARDNLDEAEQMHRKSLEINERLGHLEGMAKTYLNLGNVLQIRGDLEGAEQMYRKSLEVDQKLGRLEGMAMAYGNLGVVLQTRHDLEGAEQMHRKQLEIDEKLGRLEGMANSYGNLGNVLLLRGNLDEAEQMYRKSLEIFEKLGRLEGMAIAYLNIGFVMKSRGDLDGVEEMSRKSLATAERMGSPSLITKAKSLLNSLQKTPSDKQK